LQVADAETEILPDVNITALGLHGQAAGVQQKARVTHSELD